MPALIRSRRRRDRGAVGVEFALVLMVLVPVCFGIVEFGFLFRDGVAVASAARAGARMASSEPRAATYATDAAAQVAKALTGVRMDGLESMLVYKADPATGDPIGGYGSCSQCARFTWNSATRSFTKVSDTWAASSQKACAGQARDTVGVHLRLRHSSVTGLIFSGVSLSETAVMSLEPLPTTKVCS